jgi:hypothetical protein
MSKHKSLTWFIVGALLAGTIGFWVRPSAEGASAQQENRHSRNPFEGIDVTGTILSGGTFRGEMDIVGFTREGSQLLANGFLEGTLRDANGRRIGSVENVFVTGFPIGLDARGQAAPLQTETATATPTIGIPIGSPPTFVTSTATGTPPTSTPTGSPTTATPVGTPGGPVACNILILDLGPLDLNLLGLRVQLNDIHLRITAEPGPGNLLGNLLCAVAHLLDGNPIPGQLDQITTLLNRVIDLLGG